MNRPSSSYNGARPTITQIANAPQQQHTLAGPQQFVRLVPSSPGTIPAKVQTDLGPHRIAPTRLHTLHSTTPISARRLTREAPPRQLPPSLPYQRRPQQPPITSQNQAALVSFLDHTFRSYAERIQSELTNLRTVCSRAIFREQQDKEKWRRHCVTFKQERDVARERVRALIGEREAQMARAGAGAGVGTGASAEGESSSGSKRPRDEDASSEHGTSRDSTPSSTTAVAISDPEDDSNLYSIGSPSPTYLPLDIDPTLDSPRSPPPRCRSADAVLYSSSTMTKKRDVTAFDVTITDPPTGDRRIPCQHVPKRRRKGSPNSSTSTSTAVEDATSIQEQGSCILGVLGKDSVEVEEVGVHDITNRPKASPEPSAYVPPPSPPFKPLIPKIELTHVDLMYVPTNGKLVCRACLLHCNKLPQSTRPSPTSFPTNAQWDLLRNHCMTQHPTECADVARLHPAEVYVLRRGLMMRP